MPHFRCSVICDVFRLARKRSLAIAMQSDAEVASRSEGKSGKGRCQTHEGDKVRFRVSDVFLPSPEELSSGLATDAQLEGIVRGFSDSGSEARVFAVVDVVQRQTLVVPVDKLTRLSTWESKTDKPMQ